MNPVPRDRLSILIWCPDQHLEYAHDTPDRSGIGGGVTARIRMAAALARRGHDVRVVCNCGRERSSGGVRYVPLQAFAGGKTDVLVINSSASDLRIDKLDGARIEARLRLLWVQGTPAPATLHQLPFDYLYPCSDFVRRVAIREWGLPGSRIFVCHNGIEASLFGPPGRFESRPKREPFWMVFNGHPSKGLDNAIAVVKMIRETEPRFELHVYGGYRLWGEAEKGDAVGAGVVDHGIVGQKELARALSAGSFALHLQTREEPFGIALRECMAAGCIVLASPVGAYPELIEDGYNGFLLPGPPHDPAVHRRAAQAILTIAGNAGYAEFLRRNSVAIPALLGYARMGMGRSLEVGVEGTIPPSLKISVVLTARRRCCCSLTVTTVPAAVGTQAGPRR